ncbi:MAG: glutaredoxin family protein [Chloroflexota bacterium]
MSAPTPDLILTVYSRAGCHLCDEMRAELAAALDDRSAAGRPVPTVHEVDVDSDADLQARYGGLVPVYAVGGLELPLAMSGRQLRAFLDKAITAGAGA